MHQRHHVTIGAKVENCHGKERGSSLSKELSKEKKKKTIREKRRGEDKNQCTIGKEWKGGTKYLGKLAFDTKIGRT